MSKTQREPRLYELLANSRNCSIFSDILFKYPELQELLLSLKKCTVFLVPSNTFLKTLQPKPWLPSSTISPSDNDAAIQEYNADKMLHDLVKAHIVPNALSLEPGKKYKTLGDITVCLTQNNQGECLINNSILILSQRQAKNGSLLIINETLSAPGI
ncbi:meiotically upregulated Mug57 [Schizosaccharomyces japonicus yFS275]|uniref:Meiotically upregulated Mug57 n=1 Tax=Schizosaccharomyces japonicus (strain yFS275 / FY16936) TaxID=402676 RepID=B6K5M2_SCHJY|nr:meiotically upregulated Mug57 [Schizosaccharomyces japonicus yFS275]EEB08826.1 meiotically upregulated Mug57 [Schizosaccharomyces japonicus yFS275]